MVKFQMCCYNVIMCDCSQRIVFLVQSLEMKHIRMINYGYSIIQIPIMYVLISTDCRAFPTW